MGQAVDTGNILQLSESWSGYTPIGRRRPPDWTGQLAAFSELMENKRGVPAHRWEYELKEAMTTDSFPELFGDSLQRELLSLYHITEPNMEQICKRGSIKDFRTAKIIKKRGFVTQRLNEVAEKGEYLAREYREELESYKLKKWGNQVDFSWETYINDDLGLFADTAKDLADASRNTINWLITSLFHAAAGPIDASFAVATATAPLTIANLETGLEALAAQTHPDTGEPMQVRAKFIEIGPALELTLAQILESTIKMWVYPESDEGGPFPYPTTNVVAKYGLVPIINPWLPIVNTTSGATAWTLYADPKIMPAAEIGFLRGREAPELFMKSSDSVRVGGGAVSPFDGDFASDNIMYKIRHCFNGAVIEPYAAYASTGAG
jgi:hypothetical protein